MSQPDPPRPVAAEADAMRDRAVQGTSGEADVTSAAAFDGALAAIREAHAGELAALRLVIEATEARAKRAEADIVARTAEHETLVIEMKASLERAQMGQSQAEADAGLARAGVEAARRAFREAQERAETQAKSSLWPRSRRLPSFG